jgi:DNA repair exonuclease SbcCD ATPase subunit
MGPTNEKGIQEPRFNPDQPPKKPLPPLKSGKPLPTPPPRPDASESKKVKAKPIKEDATSKRTSNEFDKQVGRPLPQAPSKPPRPERKDLKEKAHLDELDELLHEADIQLEELEEKEKVKPARQGTVIMADTLRKRPVEFASKLEEIHKDWQPGISIKEFTTLESLHEKMNEFAKKLNDLEKNSEDEVIIIREKKKLYDKAIEEIEGKIERITNNKDYKKMLNELSQLNQKDKELRESMDKRGKSSIGRTRIFTQIQKANRKIDEIKLKITKLIIKS